VDVHGEYLVEAAIERGQRINRRNMKLDEPGLNGAGVAPRRLAVHQIGVVDTNDLPTNRALRPTGWRVQGHIRFRGPDRPAGFRATRSVAPVTAPASASISLADVAGKWKMRSTDQSGGNPVEVELVAKADSDWTIIARTGSRFRSA
jgi:hypothetical protein